MSNDSGSVSGILEGHLKGLLLGNGYTMVTSSVGPMQITMDTYTKDGNPTWTIRGDSAPFFVTVSTPPQTVVGGGIRRKASSTKKIHVGPKGGRYTITRGKKVYL